MSTASQSNTTTTTPEVVPTFKSEIVEDHSVPKPCIVTLPNGGYDVEQDVTTGQRELYIHSPADARSVGEALLAVAKIHEDQVEGASSKAAPTHAELIGDACFVCKSTEAWHGCITEDDSTKFACDGCGVSVAIKPAPKPATPKRRRPFGFSVEIENGQLFIDIRGEQVAAFRPGWYLQIGNMTIQGARESDRLEKLWQDIGRTDVEFEQREAAAS